MYFSLAVILFFKIVILGQSVAATFINKTVPGDLEDCASKAEYKDKDGQEIHAAAKSGNLEILELLLSQGFQVDSRNEEGYTPLMYAALFGHEGAFEMLIQNGADPSLKAKEFSMLHFAAQGRNTSIINKLLSRGLDVDARDADGTTALMYTALNGHEGAFQMLIQNGADPSLKSKIGFSLLHFAAQGGNTSIINELLSLGLDVHLKDVYGVTALTRAIENSNSDAVKFLISKGALKEISVSRQ